MRRAARLAVGAALGVAGCAGNAAAPPSQAPAAASPPPATVTSPANAPGAKLDADVSFQRSEAIALSAATAHDCAHACRALGSMERSAAHLCHLDASTCADVTDHVVRSRGRIHEACGSCPDGRSLEPSAPLDESP